jgi:hypothetical protein
MNNFYDPTMLIGRIDTAEMMAYRVWDIALVMYVSIYFKFAYV